MSSTPPTLSRRTKIALALLCFLVLAYAVVIAGQILLGVMFCAFVYSLVLAYYLVQAFSRFVGGVERIASALEAIAERENPTFVAGDGGVVEESAAERDET
ncbi:hypothetical protein [Halogeometricum limi]|uniref:Uncharacterized protein n=1 Tax=Halogeometricum limi TaxID=555875 RepID=A0A1I6GQC5_9EURY|nr:hypothetical protein [Halogeometricum limi]SFR44455.1 hypothetical protein SAMN04488124_1400 [Halogeometricum limi]